ncbi:MAG: hypothetical protein HC915_16905 [Anaerolineae bacterium]|nr:hypothetical protein [Anaerolineae bacterium]
MLAGFLSVPFHADEADHLYKARDYAIYFVLGQPGRLRVDPPVQIDSEAHIRLLTGTTSAYLHGFSLWHSRALALDAWQPPWYYPR